MRNLKDKKNKMDLKNNDLNFESLNKNEKVKEKKMKENNSEEDIYFYIMTLQADGQRHQIKIFENSNASELAFNFCKTYNLDFQTMKYLKKCIKQIILHFNNTKKNEMIYLLKDNSSIQEVAEEEIITDNSLKKSGTYKKNNSNNLNINNEEKSKIKKNLSKENIQSNLSEKKTNCNDIKKYEKKDIYQKSIEKKEKKEKNEKEINKLKNIIEDEGQIESKDYSIDYCLENESLEIFSATEQTTKIEQKSSIKNSYSLNQKKNYDLNNKKKKSKNKKLQINNNNTINYNRIKKENCLFNLNKTKKGKNKNIDINNNFRNILMQYKDIKSKEKNISKTKSQNKSKSKERKFEIEKEKYFIKKNNNFKYNKKPKSLEKIKTKISNKTVLINNKNPEISKQLKNNHIIKKHEKFLTNMNEIKNKFFSNYYDYFIKTKNFNTLTKNNIGHKYQTSCSINQESNRSKSISQHKINKNMTQKISMRNKTKKEKSMIHLNTLNHLKINNTSKLNLNTILKKESFSKEKQKTVFKNKIKTKYNIICNKNNNIFNKTMNGQCLTSRAKIKNVNGNELFMESKKVNSNGIRQMVTESLLNIHKFKEPIKDKRKKNIYINQKIKGFINNNKSRNYNTKDIYFKNDSNIENSINLQEKKYFESGNNNLNLNLNNNINNMPIKAKNKRNITDINLIRKINLRNVNK